MRFLLRSSTVLLMSIFVVNAYSQLSSATNYNGGREVAVYNRIAMKSTSAFSAYDVQPLNTQSLSMYGATSQIMYGNYTIPMAAKDISGGETLEDDEPIYAVIRRALGGEEGLRPGYDPEDPFHTPVGEVPVALLILLAAMVTYLRARKIKATQQTQTA